MIDLEAGSLGENGVDLRQQLDDFVDEGLRLQSLHVPPTELWVVLLSVEGRQRVVPHQPNHHTEDRVRRTATVDHDSGYQLHVLLGQDDIKHVLAVGDEIVFLDDLYQYLRDVLDDDLLELLIVLLLVQRVCGSYLIEKRLDDVDLD